MLAVIESSRCESPVQDEVASCLEGQMIEVAPSSVCGYNDLRVIWEVEL
jgi:hypothetical protein